MIPTMLPMMSKRYASNASKFLNVRAVAWPNPAMTRTTSTKITGRLTHWDKG